jgi:mono/diheme cytochrome c family protein
MKQKKLLTTVVGLLLLVLAACGGAPADDGVARPSTPGEPGEAINLTGDPVAGKKIFDTNCVACHGEDGKGGVQNPGSVDGTVPSLNPVDPDLWNPDYATFAYNADLFIEHGSMPDHTDPSVLPTIRMISWGDSGVLSPQDIADVIAYIYSLNTQ